MACLPDGSVSAEPYDRPMIEDPMRPTEKLSDEHTDTLIDQWRHGDPAPPANVPAVRRSALPSPVVWGHMTRMAGELAQSMLIKNRGYHRPEDVLVILLAAHDLNISSTLAIQRIYPIEGKATMAAELMVALVQREGHDIWPELVSETKVIAAGKRLDSDRVTTVEWTIDQAKAANLVNKDNWKKYPSSMLWARAVSQLCRMRFADVLAGITYTPDEVGAVTDEDGNVLEAPGWDAEPTVEDPLVSAAVQAELKDRAARLPDDLRVELNATWKTWTQNGNLRKLAELHESDMTRVESLFGPIEKQADERLTEDADVVDGDVIPDGGAADVCDECQAPGPRHDPDCSKRPF